MRRSRQVALILAAIGVAGLAFYILRPKQPQYQGKTLEQWMLEGQVPTEVVRAIGVASIPELVRFVDAEPSKFARAIDWAARKIKIGRGVNKIFVLKGRTIQVFYVLGTNGASAVPSLLHIMKQDRPDDPYSAATAAHCLAHVGESGIRGLVDALSHTNWRTRHVVAYGLNALHDRMDDPDWQRAVAVAVSAVPTLLNCITNDTHNVAFVCFGPLQALAKEIPWVVPSLVGALQHTNVSSSPAMLREALNLIAAFGPQASEATNAVAQFLTHSDPKVVAQASATLERLHPNP